MPVLWRHLHRLVVIAISYPKTSSHFLVFVVTHIKLFKILLLLNDLLIKFCFYLFPPIFLAFYLFVLYLLCHSRWWLSLFAGERLQKFLVLPVQTHTLLRLVLRPHALPSFGLYLKIKFQ